MENQCLSLLERTCHEVLWEQYGSTIELTLSFWELAQIAIAFFIFIVVRNILVDGVKRDVLLGYVPTLIVLVKDKSTDKMLLTEQVYNTDGGSERISVLQLSQGVMETPYIRDEARRIVEEELGLDRNEYRLTRKELTVGRRKIKNFKKSMPNRLGFTLFKAPRGRVYKVIQVETSLTEKEDGIYGMFNKLASIRVEDYHLYSPKEALEALEENYQGITRLGGKLSIYRSIFKSFGYTE